MFLVMINNPFMNCIDSLRSFSQEFTDSKFYVIKEGFSELVEENE